MTLRRRDLAVLGVAIVSIVFLSAFQSSTRKDPLNKTSNGVALKGFDAVAYFEDGMAVKGRRDFEFE